MGAAAAVVLIKERHVVEAFERAGALSPDRALVPSDVGVETNGIGWRRLRDRAVVRESAPGSGRFYLDVEVWEAQRRMRQRIMLVVLLVAAVFTLLTYFVALR
jgi:hypothetical protein